VPTVVREIIAGIGIRSTIKAGLVSYDANSIFQGAIGGLVQGVASIGINYATQELGLNPLLANLGFSAISAAINAGIQATIGEIDPITHKRIDVLEAFFSTYYKNACAFLGYGLTPDINDKQFYYLDGNGNKVFNSSAYNAAWNNYLWLETSYKASILDFSDIVRQKGLVEALNIYGTSFFNSTAVGAIAQSGQTIGKYFSDKLSSGQFRIETKNGKTYTAVDTPTQSDGKKSTAFFEWITTNGGYWNLIGKEEVLSDYTFWGFGELGKDSYGNLGFWDDALLMDTYNNFTLSQTMDGDNITSLTLFDSSGDAIERVTPLQGESGITFNSEGGIENGQADYINQYIRLEYHDGVMVNASLLSGTLPSGGTTTFAEALDTYDNPLFDIDSYDRAAAKQNYELFVHEVVLEYKTLLGFSNEIANRIEEKLKTSGNNIIDNPKIFNSEKQNIEDVSGIAGLPAAWAADLGTIIQKKAKEWGVNKGLEGGNLNMAKGFLVYFAGDFVGDTLRLGEGTAEAMTLFEQGHPVKGTLSLLGDLGRATMLTQGLTLIGKALSITGGIAGAITSESADAFGNAFRLYEKVYRSEGSIVRLLAKQRLTDAVKFGIDDFVYGPSAGLKLRDFANKYGGKLLEDLLPPGTTPAEGWLQFSINNMENVLRDGNKIHFDLTNLNDIVGVLKGTGQYANTVTAGELRYICNNWNRFQNVIKFYKDNVEVVLDFSKLQ